MNHFTLAELKALGEGITPGTWHADYLGDGRYSLSAVRPGTLDEDLQPIGTFTTADGEGASTDARLIAAAPVLLAQATAQAEELTRLRAALTPSEKTKYVYNGEFSFQFETFDEDGENLVFDVFVPWTTIKDIMAAILKHADAQAGKGI